MKSLAIILIVPFLLTACSHTYYVVRHAEKGTAVPGEAMTSPDNPKLSPAGEQRALALKEVLKDKKVAYIFSTNTIRTQSTAEPLRALRGLKTETYRPIPDSAFIQKLKGLRKNVLIVGHSNTVDDIVNALTGEKSVPGDLQDSEYDNLFVIIYKGNKVKEYQRRKYNP